MNQIDIIEQREFAKNYCAQNIKELCEEIVEWHDTLILKQGGKVRVLANLLNFVGGGKLQVAEHMISMKAMEIVAQQTGDE